MLKINQKTCVCVHDLNVTRRIVLFNKPILKSNNTRKVFYGPIQFCLPMDEKNYYDVFTGERLVNPESVARSTRRARNAIIDLAKLNSFTHFGTITLSDEKHNVHDVEACVYAMLSALKSYKQLSPEFKYIIVPEYGEKKKRLHFHFLMKGIRKEDLFVNEHRHLDFKYFKERFGHVQITKIGGSRADIERTAIYCGKYITKDNIQVRTHRYFRSKDLLKVIKRTIENPFLSVKIRECLNKYFDETCYYDDKCICYELPAPLYEEIRIAVMERYCQMCYLTNVPPNRWKLYELP